MKSQQDDAVMQLKSLIEILQQDEEETKMVFREDGTTVDDIRDEINIMIERKEILENECRGCARLKSEVNRVTLELESAKEIIRILKEELESAVMEVRNTKSPILNKDNKSEPCRVERSQFQSQKNNNRERGDKINDKLKENNEILAKTGYSDEVVTKSKEVAKTTDQIDSFQVQVKE
jgi:hypothetical protein